ncbi:hypothetical protein DY000_02025058 [Brassica cretica]|uniref:Inositol polyphosphate-related phosphatase domain-containing protein n=1 Tax=Brassica cretica TaxID=69181 RepID=A0ABQ7E378_BRACR|nr:hypothetical protein DY000_02025058 [Brassica cretica]
MSSSVAEPAGTMKKSYRLLDDLITQRLWAKLVMRKWLNRSASEPDYGADTEDESENVDVGLENYYSSSDEDVEVSSTRRRESTQSRVCENAEDDMAAAEFICNDAPMKLRRRNSETFRAQYINNKEIRVCVGTWNVGGTSPPSDLDIDDWIEINSPADIYVIGLQEVVPLNAGNILGGEDNRPVAKWEEVIREALNRVRPKHSAVKSYSDPPSPGRFKPFEETHDVIEEEVGYENDSDSGVEIHPIDEEEVEDSELKHDGGVISEVNTLVDLKSGLPVVEINRQFSSQLDRQVYSRSNSFEKRRNHDDSSKTGMKTLNRMLSGQERIGLSWPEPPLNMLGPSCVLDRQPSIKTYKSLQTLKSFKAYNSFKSVAGHNVGISPEVVALASMDLKLLMERKRRPAYVRLGAVSVSMSINQTFFCFICTHLTAGEREVDQIKRNADVHEIHKRTVFHSVSALGLPKHIYDHERIIWLGDLNYRLNLSYEKTRDLISKKDWSKILEYDQLVNEYKKGRAFDGWSEGTLQFAPTYKYQANSEYTGANGKATLRKPAWCDRILSYGKGMRLVHYRRTEHKFSDHRPVTATYMAEVEVFSTRKLQRMLTFTDAEIEDESLVAVVV